MAFIDTDYVDNAIGSDVRSNVAPDSNAFDQFEAMARAKVKAACAFAGYELGDTTTNDMVKMLTLGQWVWIAYGARKGLEVPGAILDSLRLLDGVRQGEVPIPGLTPSSRDGVGGTKFSTTSTNVASSVDTRPRMFGRKQLKTW